MMRKAILAVTLVLSVSTTRAEQKNVTLLSGMSDVELQRTMNFIRASLGVHCDFCHVVNDKTGWDFASDEKKTKRTARHMIEMVETINQQSFEGNPAVSCMTCHRGSTRPVSLPVLPQTPPPFPTPIPVRPALPTRDEVVAKYAASLGDATRLQSARSVRGTREAFDGKGTPFEAQSAGGKWHIVAQTPEGRIEQVISGDRGWTRTEKGVEKISADDLERYRGLSAAYEPLPPSGIPADARVVNKEKIGDHDTVIVAGRIDDQTRQRLFFDTTTGLLLRRVILRRVSIGEIPQQTDFEDYRDVGGTKFPFLVRVSMVDPWSSATRHYSDVDLAARIDEAIFNPPAGSPP